MRFAGLTSTDAKTACGLWEDRGHLVNVPSLLVSQQLKGLSDISLSLENLHDLASAELGELTKRVQAIDADLMQLIIDNGAAQQKQYVFAVSACTHVDFMRTAVGGEEASAFAHELFLFYRKYLSMILLQSSLEKAPMLRFRENSAFLFDAFYHRFLKYESGVHRVQRVPKSDAKGRVHTSTVSVSILPHTDDPQVHIRESDVRMDVFRASGAGGQHVNKTNSAVRLVHLPSGITISNQDERSQVQNKAKAMQILQERLRQQQSKRSGELSQAIFQEQVRTRLADLKVKTADRAYKSRTYNFPQNRVTDHRLGVSFDCELFLCGNYMQDLYARLGLWDFETKMQAVEERVKKAQKAP